MNDFPTQEADNHEEQCRKIDAEMDRLRRRFLRVNSTRQTF
jgi:hypothetical protein